MNKAVRFAAVNTVAEAVADMLNNVEFVAKSYEEELKDMFGWDISVERVKFLMESQNMGLFEAYDAYCAEQRAIELSNEEWLADPANRDSEIYSDVFKDTYGFRPRW